jgi:hypothetical protein
MASAELHVGLGPQPVRLRASTSHLQFPREPTLLTDVGSSHLGHFATFALARCAPTSALRSTAVAFDN